MAGSLQGSFGVRGLVSDDIRPHHLRHCVSPTLSQKVRLYESIAQLSQTHERPHLETACTFPRKRQKLRLR